MKITVVSEFRPGYHVGLEESYARAFESLGHVTTKVGVPRPGEMPRGVGQLAALATALQKQGQLRSRVEDSSPDLVVIVKGAGILGGTVRAWQQRGARVVNVFPDNPFDAAGVDLAGRTLFDQFRALDRLFVHDRFAVGQLVQMGIRADFIAFAHDPALHGPDKVGDVAPSDPIVFVGNPDGERIRYLRAIADLGLGVWGNWSWAKLAETDPLATCVRGGVQLGSDLVRVMRSARISINVLRNSQKTAHNMRTFETPACAVCSVSEDSVGVAELFEPDDEVVLFSSPDDLRNKVRRLLDSSSEPERIARAGRARVIAETYAKRASEILQCV